MEVYGLFGEKLSHSFSPNIFNILFKKYDLNGTYSTYEINKDNFKNAVKSIKTLGINGVNVTIPYKIDVIEQLDEVDESVEKIGACNCIKIYDGKSKGYNTDYYGVLDALNFNDIDVKNKDCVVLGSGGASKSVVSLLKDLNAKSITVVKRNSNIEKIDDVNFIDYNQLEKIEKAYLLVNTTPVGMYPNVDESPVSKDIISKFEVCFDAVYNPLETKFLAYANELEIKTINGLYMLVGQAINAFTIFNGIEISKDEFFNIYMEVEKLLTQKI